MNKGPNYHPKVAIVNPNSRGGGGRKHFHKIVDYVSERLSEDGSRVLWMFTEAPGDATRIARCALEGGTGTIISVGGDGTHNEVLQGLFDDKGELIDSRARLGFINFGTGGDFLRSLGIGPKVSDGVDAIVGERERVIDLGRIEYSDSNGITEGRYFLNVASLGVSGLIDSYVGQIGPRRVGGTIAFAAATARALLSHKPVSFRIVVDDEEEKTCLAQTVVLANGKYFGGGMKIAPEAIIDDGLLDVVSIGDYNLLGFLRHGHRLYAGTHTSLNKVWSSWGRKIQIRADRDVMIDIDGESATAMTATVEIVPSSLRVLAAR